MELVVVGVVSFLILLACFDEFGNLARRLFYICLSQLRLGLAGPGTRKAPKR